MPKNRRAQILELAEEMAPDLKKIVEDIENRTPTTKNHYGEYMAFLSNADTLNLNVKVPEEAPLVSRMFVSICLIKAGGNRAGIRSALQQLHPEASADLI